MNIDIFNVRSPKSSYANIFIFLTTLIVVFGAGNRTFAQSTERTDFNRRAFEHFRNGLLFDLQGNTDEAIRELIRASQIDSNNAVILKSLGDIYIFKAQDYALGAAVYEKYLEQNPFHDRTIDVVTQIYFQSRPPRLERLEKVLSMIIGKGNDQPKYYASLVDVLLGQKKLQYAENMAIMFIKRTGELQDACEEVAELFEKNSMVLEGIEFFSDYLSNNPGSANIGIVVGRLYEAMEDLSAAEKAYLNVLRKNETAYMARLRLAEIYRQADKIDNVLNLYDVIDFDDPMEIPVKLGISDQLLQKTPNTQYAQIESIMESVRNKVSSKSQYYSQVYSYLGRAQAGQERHTEAIENYNKSLREDPVDVVVLYYLAQSEMELENFNGAIAAISKAIKLRPEEKAFYVYKGLVYDRMGDFDNAIATYEAGIAVESPNTSAQATLLNNYSYLLSEHDTDLDRALEMAIEAVNAEPENSSFLDTIGWVYFKLGNLQEALKYIKQSVELISESAEVLDHLGDVYHKLGNITQAREYWQKALDNDSDNQEIKEKLETYKN